jgi:hypothetical protein
MGIKCGGRKVARGFKNAVAVVLEESKCFVNKFGLYSISSVKSLTHPSIQIVFSEDLLCAKYSVSL